MPKAEAKSPPTRLLTVLAQDPNVRTRGRILTAQIPVPIEDLGAGPRGYRVHVIDVDATTNALYRPLILKEKDPYEKVGENPRMLRDPRFHAQNVYAIVMATLGLFELALGRRTPWGFSGQGHQIKVLPHAFADANAFYVRQDEALAFGYFPGTVRKGEMVFACLSHDVVAHETTHALVDGLRPRFEEASSPQQAGFHEGFADCIALLSVFRLPECVEQALAHGAKSRKGWIPIARAKPEWLKESVLASMAEQMGQEMAGVRGEPLRRSAELKPRKDYLQLSEFQEPHRMGEVLVAAVMNSFLEIWSTRLTALKAPGAKVISRQRMAEEGAAVAENLLSVLIRALDYTPPVDLQFEDFLSALLTADEEVYPDDSKFEYRTTLTKVFGSYGIVPVTPVSGDRPGQWDAPPKQPSLERNRFESMQRDRQEMFRFVWENRRVLGLERDAYTMVSSVRPSFRLGQEGFPLRETVAEYVQILDLEARELKGHGLTAPEGMPASLKLRLFGGGALIFDEFGHLKFHIGSGVTSCRQNDRLLYRWRSGEFDELRASELRFALLHRQRATDSVGAQDARW